MTEERRDDITEWYVWGALKLMHYTETGDKLTALLYKRKRI